MKLNFIKYAMFLGALFMVVSCSEDFLETTPTNQTSNATVFENTKNAKMAINGLAKLMSRQYLSSQGYNGEGTIKMYYGNYPGNYFVVDHSSRTNQINGNYYDNTSSTYTYYPWFYYYKIIGNANEIIFKIDGTDGPQREKDAIKAQALTYRAYSYFMLSQLYGNRWQDSNNGQTPAVVLRTEPTSEELPLSSLGEIYDQVYADLDMAINLFDASNYTRDKNYELDKQVAEAIYARAAITKAADQSDYEKAARYAKSAREGYPLMDVEAYKDGFANPTSEWIWSIYGASDETLYYYSYFAYIGYNSNASNVRTKPKLISKELYDQIPKSDIRRDLFLDPQGMKYNKNTGKAAKELSDYAFEMWPDLANNAVPYAYMQFKIKNNDNPGVGNLNNMRSSELYLIEAEAKHFLNDDVAAQNLLEELNVSSGRDPNYTVSKTGDALFEEIKKYRAIELWAEGFDWFDLKRWGDPIDRKSGAEGGNFPPSVAVFIGPNEKRNWTWVIPDKETDHNEFVD